MAIGWRKTNAVLIGFLGKFWTLPNTLAGLVLGCATIPFGSRPVLEHNAFVFNHFPVVRRAFVLGNVILNPAEHLGGLTVTYKSLAKFRKTGGACTLGYVHLGKHEEAHTLQYQVLGPLFLPLYALTQILSSPTPFERAADRYAETGRGWWPWS